MRRRDFFRLMTTGLGARAALPAALGFVRRVGGGPVALAHEATAATSAKANYPNNRAPLLESKYVRLPLGSIRPSGWLRDQFNVQVNGLSGHVGEVWDVLKVSAWKGDTGKNVTPECCTPRFVPRWLEGLTVLAGVLGDEHLKALTDPYIQYILPIEKPATITPSVCAWSHLGRFLPDYYELTGDERAVKLTRRILDYADSVRDSGDKAVVEPARLGMLLSFGLWYYNQTGDSDIPALLQRCTKSCVDDWKNYFVSFPGDPKYFVHFPDVTAERPKAPLAEWTRQGVDVTQAIQYPVQYSLISKDEADSDSVCKGIANLDKGYGQVGGRWSGDEWLASTDPTQGTELCDIEELLFCLEKNFEILGDAVFADRIEQLIYNSFPGTCTPDMWAHQYDQQANQVLVSVADRHWHNNDDTSNIYGFTPNFPCCLANMHSPWPRFVQTMWMATADSGLVAATYGPCRVTAMVAERSPVEIVEETNYPFSDRVRVTVHVKQPVTFPIYFRIPVWADGAELTVAGEAIRHSPASGTFFKLDRRWTSGDVVTLDFNFKVRTETRHNNAVAIAWGSLYFVLRIGESFKKLPALVLGPSYKDVPAPPGCVNWEITPTTDWNYALAIDRNNPQCTITTNKISSMPFAQKGEMVKRPGADDFAPWTEDVPMVLRVKAKKVPQWGMAGTNAAPVPASPVYTDFPETLVELIPYGCSRLRIAEFPTV
jgi:uncharacterized protein